jgi:hypothetical protein
MLETGRKEEGKAMELSIMLQGKKNLKETLMEVSFMDMGAITLKMETSMWVNLKVA